jgi:hypothetical protein
MSPEKQERDTDTFSGVQYRDTRQGGRCYPQQYDMAFFYCRGFFVNPLVVDQAVTYILSQPDGMYILQSPGIDLLTMQPAH